MLSIIILTILYLNTGYGYIRNYKGFDDCGYGGWFCNRLSSGSTETIFDCNSIRPTTNVRLWMWTARIPHTSTTFIIQNCGHVELHLDCTAGTREYNLQTLRVINVTQLEFLKPIKPRVFLHDNDQVAQVPSNMQIINSTILSLYTDMFNKPGGRCRYPALTIKNINFENVNINNIQRSAINASVDMFSWSNVTVQSMEPSSVVLTGASAVTIDGSIFTHIPNSGLCFDQVQSFVHVINNHIGHIDNAGLTANTPVLLFSNNKVGTVESQALAVLATSTTLSHNIINNLHTNALSNISPGIVSIKYIKGNKFSYVFEHNKIYNMEVGALHMNWPDYQDIGACVKTIVTDNILNCSCSNSKWLSFTSGLGERLNAYKAFYELFLEQNNTCFNNCTVKYVSNNCANNITDQSACLKSNLTEEFEDDLVPKEYLLTTELEPQEQFTTTKQQLVDSLTSHLHNMVTDNTSPPTYSWVLLGVLLTLVIITVAFFIFKSAKAYKENRHVVQVRRMKNEDDDMVAVLE